MYIQYGCEFIFEIHVKTPMMLMLYTHPSLSQMLKHPDNLVIDPVIPIQDFLDTFGNRCGKIVAPPGKLRIYSDNVIYDSGKYEEIDTSAQEHVVDDLPPDVLQFLLASRYCEVDRFLNIAFQLFGHIPPGWPRVQAISNWVHNHILFGHQFTRPNKTAWDVYTELTGVCRDLTHLAITFCRAMNIPARYATGYLGDIGEESSSEATDFMAYFEVYLNHQWYTFDARNNKPQVGRILVARGRDAVDVALTTSFGAVDLKNFKVWCFEV